MLNECIEGLKIKQNGIYLDGTLGGAGHSKEIAKALNNTGILVGIDRDQEALQAARQTKKLLGRGTPERGRFAFFHPGILLL